MRAAAVMVFYAVFTIGASQAFWTCCTSAGGVVDEARLYHEVSTTTLVASSIELWEGGKMACRSSSVGAADAKKAEVASFFALLKPMPPFLTESDACSHWMSLSSMLRIDGSPKRRVLANVHRRG